MSDLLNAVVTTETITEYDRSYAGGFANPYNGTPSLSFNMQRVRVTESGEIISSKELPKLSEAYVPGKTYDLYDPVTAQVVPGQTFSAEHVQMVLFSVMMRAAEDARLAAIAAAEAAAAKAAAEQAASQG